MFMQQFKNEIWNYCTESPAMSFEEINSIQMCVACNYYFSDEQDIVQEDKSIVDPQNQLFSIRSVNLQYKLYKRPIYFKARLIEVLDCKCTERYQVMNLLVLDEHSDLRVLSLLTSDESNTTSLSDISKMLLTYQVPLTDKAVIKGLPRVIHMHEDQSFPENANIQMNVLSEIVDDQNCNLIHKTYNLVSVLKHFQVNKLANFQFSCQNAEAILVLVDSYQVTFKARIWGDYDKLQKLRIKDIIFLKNYKIDYDQSTSSCVQVCSMGYSKYEQNPLYLKPCYNYIFQQVISQTFNENIAQFIETNSTTERTITDCFIHTAFLDDPVKIIFQDSQGQLISTVIEDNELATKIKNEDLSDYVSVSFNIVIRQKMQISKTGEPSIIFVLAYLN